MTKISANLFFLRKVFPLIFFGAPAIAITAAIWGGVYKKAPPVLVVPCALAIVGYVVMKKLVWDLMDEVYDCGDHLLVKKGDEEERIPLSSIINVGASIGVNPPRISLRLATPGRFGDEVVFSPVRTFTLNPFARNPIAEDLIVRVDKARASRTF
jgi:hypothetical protein